MQFMLQNPISRIFAKTNKVVNMHLIAITTDNDQAFNQGYSRKGVM